MHETMSLHKHKQRETPADMKSGLPLIRSWCCASPQQNGGKRQNNDADILGSVETDGNQGLVTGVRKWKRRKGTKQRRKSELTEGGWEQIL